MCNPDDLTLPARRRYIFFFFFWLKSLHWINYREMEGMPRMPMFNPDLKFCSAPLPAQFATQIKEVCFSGFVFQAAGDGNSGLRCFLHADNRSVVSLMEKLVHLRFTDSFRLYVGTIMASMLMILTAICLLLVLNRLIQRYSLPYSW